MTIKKISKEQPESFKFSQENLLEAEKEIKKYPKDRKASAILALLYLVQKQNDNWIPIPAIRYVAKLLGVPYMQVYEVSTFYSMFNLTPVGKYFIQICTTTPCMIRGSKKIVDVCTKNPIWISDTATALSAIDIMNTKKITSLLVARSKDVGKKIKNVVGIIHLHHCLSRGIK